MAILQGIRRSMLIQDMVLDVFPPSSKYEPEGRFHSLKRNYYSQEERRWAEPGVAFYADTTTQLVGLLATSITAKTAKTEVERDYLDLKRSELYDKKVGAWREPRSEESYLIILQLIDCLILRQINPNEAMQAFCQLKLRCFNQANNWWHEPAYNNETPSLGQSSRIQDQILGIYLQALFRDHSAGALYTELKSLHYYRAHDGLWCYRTADNPHHISCQLIGVLVESVLNPANAPLLYEKLKINPLCPLDERDLFSQLLAVLVEARLNELAAQTDGKTLPPMPAIRRF